jgi:PPR repeat
LPQLKPRKTTFNAVLAAHSKSSHPQAVSRAADILAFMELLAETDPSVAPDNATYNTIMNCYARNGSRMDPVQAAKQADSFLRHVVEVYKKQQEEGSNGETQIGRPRIQPDTILFNTAIGLWAKTGRPGSFRKARSILDRQLDLALRSDGGSNDVVPDVVGVTSVLQSCASETKDKIRAWDVALATYRQLQNDKIGCRANHVTYGTMIKACGRLLPKEARRKWLRVIFQDAIQAGSVGDMVVSKLREAASPDLYRELMQGHSKKQLPAEWTSRVQEQSEYRTCPLGNRKQQQRGKNNIQLAKRAEV